MNQSHTVAALAAHEEWKARTLARAARIQALHARRYPAAYAPDQSAVEGERVRSLSALASTRGVLPVYGASRPTIAETVRRFDVDDRSIWNLERDADQLLRAAGFTVDALDVVDTFTRLPTVRPDRVAFRGVVRVKVPAIHRSERDTRLRQRPSNVSIVARLRTGKLVAADVRTRVVCTERVFDVDANGLATVTYLCRTDINGLERRVTFRGCEGPGWRGYRVLKVAERVDESTPRRGKGRPAESVWTIGAPSVRTRFQRLSKVNAALGERAIDLATAARRDLLAGVELSAGGATLSIQFDGAATTSTGQSPVKVSTLADDETTRIALTFALDDVARRYALQVLAIERRETVAAS